MKNIITLLLLLVGFGLGAQTLTLKEGSVLKYKITNGTETYNLNVTLKTWAPDRVLEYTLSDGKTGTGTITLLQNALDNATVQNTDYSGGPLTLSIESTLWFSKAVFISLKRDFQARFGTKGSLPFTLLNTFEDTYKLKVDGKETPINVVYAEEQSGKPNKYWILNDENNPLLIKMVDWTLTIELTEIKL